MEDRFIDPSAWIGDRTTIAPFTQVCEGAHIGKDCTIGANCFIGQKVVIGSRCKIQNGVNIFSGVMVYDDVFIGPGVTFTNVRRPRAEFPQKPNWHRTFILKGVTIGANATIVAPTIIGKYAFVGAGAVIVTDVPRHTLIMGNPGVIKAFVCVCGINVERVDKDLVCPKCGRGYFTHRGVVEMKKGRRAQVG